MFGFTDYQINFLPYFNSELNADFMYLVRNLVGLLVQRNSSVFLYLHGKIHKDSENLDMRLCHGNVLILIYLLTAIGLTPGGNSTVNIYTQTIHRITQLTTLTKQFTTLKNTINNFKRHNLKF